MLMQLSPGVITIGKEFIKEHTNFEHPEGGRKQQGQRRIILIMI